VTSKFAVVKNHSAGWSTNRLTNIPTKSDATRLFAKDNSHTHTHLCDRLMFTNLLN